MESIAKNYTYNVIYQILSVIIPFITVPYVSRVLGAEGIGINAYTASIVQYFAIFGSLGIGLYASRTVAYKRDDKEELSKAFWSIFTLQCVLCSISFTLYIIFTIFFVDKYKLIQVIQALNLLSIAIDISWLFVGIEDFKKLIIRSIFFRILGVVCIFVFIKTPEDLWKYIVISTLSVFLGQIVMWAYLKNIVNKVKITFKDITSHLKPSLELFIPQIAIHVYLVVNKTMLGVMSTTQEVGFYESADKIVKISLASITAIGGVMLPRISNSFAKGEKDKVNYYIYTVLNFVSYLAIPFMLGMIGVSRQFISWFLGSEFTKCSTLLIILSPIVIAIAWSNVMGMQYMIPTGRTSEFTISVVVGAVLNLGLNLVFIKNFQSIGAAIATVLAEIAVTSTQMYFLRNDIKISKLYSNLGKYFISGLIMFIPVTLIGYFLGPAPKTTLIQVSTGGVVYILCLFLLKSDINTFIFSKIFNKLYKRYLARKAEV